MKKLAILFLILNVFIFSCNNNESSNNDSVQETTPEVDSVSYAIGILYSNSIYNNFGIHQINLPEFSNGVQDCLVDESDLLIHKDSCRSVISDFLKQYDDSTITPETANYDNIDKVSYAFGVDVTNTILNGLNLVFNSSQLVQGFEPLYNKSEIKYFTNIEEAGIYFENFLLKKETEELEDKQVSMRISYEDNLIDMKNMVDGKVTLKSGLQIEVINEGSGVSPSLQDQVTVHYTGKLENGTIFDSSVDRGEPVVFPVTQVIPGWTEALQLMKVGSKWNLVIPSDLAYSDQGVPQAGIAPNSVLYFEVELLKISQD